VGVLWFLFVALFLFSPPRDRVMPRAHGLRLAELLPQGRLVEVADSHTLIPLDQPASFAQLVREFTHAFDTSTP
jgi:pimeloyl-ACP methyl ester carboxylesterase